METRTHEAEARPFMAAVVQAASVAFDRERTLQKTADLAADARRRGASLVVFPEAFVSGYPRGLDFGAVVGAGGLPPLLGERDRCPRSSRRFSV